MTPAQRAKPSTGGFTPIELVAVVALVVLVAAIGIPNFLSLSWRDRAHSAALRANLRRVQVGLEGFHDVYGRFTADLDSLGYEPAGGVSLFLRTDSSGWEAVAFRERAPLTICRVGSLRPEIACDALAVPRPVSRLDSIVAALPWAATALQAPTRMRLGETRTVTLVLDPSYTPAADVDTLTVPDEMRDSLRATLAGVPEADSTYFRPVRRAERMLARLSGDGFRIDPPPADDGRLVQGILAGRATEWSWEVTAEADGRRALDMTLWALLDLSGETPVRFQVLRHQVSVSVRWGDRLAGFARRHWIWLVMLALAPPPLILWIIRKIRERKPRPPRPWEEPL